MDLEIWYNLSNMRIGIDARMINESGIGRYLRNLLDNLQELDHENEYFIFLLKNDYLNLKFKANFSKVLADFKWYTVSEQLKFPKLLTKYQLDLVHFPHFNVPLLYRDRFIVTIHDLIHQHFQMRRASTLDPVTFKIKTEGYKLVFKNAITRSSKIIVPSNFIKEQLVNEWNIRSQKVVVTLEAVEDNILRLSKVRRKSIVQGDYLFYVGNVHPHKNIERLIQAFKIVKKSHSGLKLVLSGQENYFWKRLKMTYPDDDIIYTGFISDEQLVALYKNAATFIMPSLEEGFGIPVLEAMACSCPVVGSDIGVMREVGGKAAVYFDPKDTVDMAQKIGKVLTDQRLRKELISSGMKRVRVFSWKKLAKQTLEVYLQCE